MTKHLAGYVFANEAIFLLDSDKNNRFDGGLAVSEENPAPQKPIEKVHTKPISVFVDDISKEEFLFLEKVLSSVNQPITNADIFKRSDFSQTSPQLGKDVFLFGVNPQELQIYVPAQKYSIHSYLTHRVIFTDSLFDIQKNLNDEKRKLWILLKNMFSA